MKFKYKILTKSGATEEGEIEAESRFDFYQRIKKEGNTLVSSEEVKQGKFLQKNLNLSFFNRVKIQEKIFFARNLAVMIDSGLSMSRALEILQRQTKNDYFIKTINSVNEEIRKGNALYEAMGKHTKVFPPIFVSMIKAGEESGNISEALHVISGQMEKSYLLRKKVKGAMMYPSIIVITMIIVAILMLIYIVPTLTETFADMGMDLPVTTRAIILISDILRNYTIIFFLSVALVVSVSLWFFRTDKGKQYLASFFLKMPFFSTVIKETNSATTARTLSSLLASGVDIVQAIGITKDVLQNHKFREVLQDAEKDIQKGMPISNSFLKNEDLYPILFGEMISVGEETGKISEMLMNVAEFYENEVEQKMKDFSTIIEPILMVSIGLFVGIFAVSMIAPMYSLMENI